MVIWLLCIILSLIVFIVYFFDKSDILFENDNKYKRETVYFICIYS